MVLSDCGEKVSLSSWQVIPPWSVRSLELPEASLGRGVTVAT